MSPLEAVSPSRLPEDAPERTHLPLDQNGNYRFDTSTEELESVAEETIVRCDKLFLQAAESEDLSYGSILGPLSEIDDLLQQTYCYLATLDSLHPDPVIRQAAIDTSLNIADDASGYLHSFPLYKKISAFSRTSEARSLEGEEAFYLDSTLTWLQSSGHGRPRSHRKKIRRLNSSLNKLELEYHKNIAEDQTVVTLCEEDLAGLDEQAKRAFLTDLGHGHYGLSLIATTYNSFMKSASNRETRKRVCETYFTRLKGPNGDILQRAVAARQKIAGTLGYKSWLHYCNQFNMIESPEAISGICKDLIKPLSAQARKEIAVMEEMLAADGHSGPLQTYDLQYYDAKLLQDKYNLEVNTVSEYFSLPDVLDSMFELTGSVFGLNFRPIDANTWHPEVLAFAVDDRQTGDQLGTIYMDLFPREGKYKHCCTQSLVIGRTMPDGSYRQPSSVIIANLNRPADGSPPLLNQHERVDIGFHEFGHALHDVLSKANLSAFAGTVTEIDFVEIPSQLMEHWAWDKEIMARHARHYQTREHMPEEMIDALIGAQELNLGIKYLRDISFTMFDLSLHNTLKRIDIPTLWKKAVKHSGFPVLEGTFFPATFEHLVTAYGGNYYSYVYDQIFCSDMFSRFEQEGLTSSELGAELRAKILEPGASKSGIEMVRSFLSRDVDKQAFLRNLGIAAVTNS